MIDLKTLRQLVKLMTDHDLTELDLEGEGERVKLRRREGSPVWAAGEAPVAPQAAAPPAPASPAPAAPPAGQAPAAAPAPSEGQTIDSPMVGTFYAAPSPDAPPFVAVGDRVEPDTVVCIIEAMKVFNEIKAETSGTVRRVLVENGQAVEFGQPLFEIQPT
ncbi:MAG TPA: acetyl-CoA carboxylase biotin carboxyl carrier protein [Phycisphaeraceae bacterium]